MNDRRMSDEELSAAAGDVRRNGAAGAVRHFWELMGHITALQSYACESCGLWVQLDSNNSGRGECVLPSTPNPPVRFFLCNTAQAALHTAFDHRCNGWIPRPVRTTSEHEGGAL